MTKQNISLEQISLPKDIEQLKTLSLQDIEAAHTHFDKLRLQCAALWSQRYNLKPAAVNKIINSLPALKEPTIVIGSLVFPKVEAIDFLTRDELDTFDNQIRYFSSHINNALRRARDIEYTRRFKEQQKHKEEESLGLITSEHVI